MKTTLFLIATLFISTITFSQTSKKGYDHYKTAKNSKMNKAELIDVMASDANNSKKRVTSTSRNPQTGEVIKSNGKTNDLHLRKRPGRTKTEKFHVKQEFGPKQSQAIRKKPGRTKATGYNSSRSNKNSNH